MKTPSRPSQPSQPKGDATSIMPAANLAAFAAPQAQTAPLPERCLTIRDVQQLVPFSRMHIDRLEKAGEFPRRIHIGQAQVVWKMSEILAWIEAKRMAA